MTTDYDCSKANKAPITFEMILARTAKNAERVKTLLIEAIARM
jgi:hypothetical protein